MTADFLIGSPPPSVRAQDAGHAADHDYELGSPHLTHTRLRRWIVGQLTDLVADSFRRHGRARILEVGAGHGAFTDHLLAAGAQVTITEMSRASAGLLAQRYAHNPAATVLVDPDGGLIGRMNGDFDLVVAISVLHHIPDYLAALSEWTDRLVPGGSLATFEDPLYYPRRGRAAVAASRGAYFAWRLAQADRASGLRSLGRRLRHAHDDANPRDTVEYHVLRQGVDEDAIGRLLAPRFADVAVLPYWSTPSGVLQRTGEALHATSSFGIVARDRNAGPAGLDDRCDP